MSGTSVNWSPDACIPVAELGLFFGSTSSWVGVESVVEIGFNEGVWLQSKTNSEEEALYSELWILWRYYKVIFLYIGTVALRDHPKKDPSTRSSHYSKFTVSPPQRQREERRKGKDGGGEKSLDGNRGGQERRRNEEDGFLLAECKCETSGRSHE